MAFAFIRRIALLYKGQQTGAFAGNKKDRRSAWQSGIFGLNVLGEGVPRDAGRLIHIILEACIQRIENLKDKSVELLYTDRK